MLIPQFWAVLEIYLESEDGFKQFVTTDETLSKYVSLYEQIAREFLATLKTLENSYN